LLHGLILARLASQPCHRHLQLHHEEVDVTLLDKAGQRFEDLVPSELLGREGNPLGGQVADGTVEHLQGKQFLDEGIVLQKSSLEGVGHSVLVDQSTLA